MVNPPPSYGLTHYVFENPWPAAIVLLSIGAVIAWLGAREGAGRRIRAGIILAGLGLAVIAAGMLVTTAGEHGRQVTRELVTAVVGKDLAGGMALFADDAALSVGSPQNPGLDVESIRAHFSALAQRYSIDDNTITHLRGYTISSDQAEVRLACVTTVSQSPYPNTSQWILHVTRMPDGAWKITRLTCVAINDQTPPIDRLW